MRRFGLLAGLVLAVATAGTLAGCGGPDDGMTSKQQESSDRLAQIRKDSGGRWERLSESDRQFLLQLAQGNEQSARMLLFGSTGAPGGRPGGPPGRQGGAPGTR